MEVIVNPFGLSRTRSSDPGRLPLYTDNSPNIRIAGPLFLLPGLIIGLYVTNTSLPAPSIPEIIRYLLHKRHPTLHGWGLHTAAPPTSYGTILNYVSLRILGLSKDDPVMQETRKVILSEKMGGAEGIPSWGKAWLSILGCYEWEGVNPVPPELW